MYKIMLIDDEVHILNAITRITKRFSQWEVESYSQPEVALKRATTSPFDLFLSDYHMPNMHGIEFLNHVKALQPESIRMLLTGFADLQTLTAAINEAEIYRFICKPWNDNELTTIIEQALLVRSYREENRRLADQLREQKAELLRHKSALEQLEGKYPGITKVNWGADGSILVED